MTHTAKSENQTGSGSAFYPALIGLGGLAGIVLSVVLLANAGLGRWAAGVAVGGAVGLAIGMLVMRRWVRVMGGCPADVLKALAAGFAAKLMPLVIGTIVVHFLTPGLESAGFAIGFAGSVLWVNLLGIPWMRSRELARQQMGDVRA